MELKLIIIRNGSKKNNYRKYLTRLLSKLFAKAQYLWEDEYKKYYRSKEKRPPKHA